MQVATPPSGSILAPANACPPGFVEHSFAYDFSIGANREVVWSWLDDPATFIEGQIWPFRVEFLNPEGGVGGNETLRPEPGFEVGGINVHHGPLMSFAGVLTEIRAGEYRSLDYFYGSYVLSMRLVRPTRLEFWVEPRGEDSTHVRLRVTSYVHARFAKVWTRGQALFWKRFPGFMSGAIDAPVTS